MPSTSRTTSRLTSRSTTRSTSNQTTTTFSTSQSTTTTYTTTFQTSRATSRTTTYNSYFNTSHVTTYTTSWAVSTSRQTSNSTTSAFNTTYYTTLSRNTTIYTNTNTIVNTPVTTFPVSTSAPVYRSTTFYRPPKVEEANLMLNLDARVSAGNSAWKDQSGNSRDATVSGTMGISDRCVALYNFHSDATDLTGNYTGTESNITYASGNYGQAAVFNGSSSKITTSYTANDSAFTISGWIKHTSATFVGKYPYLAGKGYYSNSSSNNYWQLVNYSSEFPEFRIRNGGASVAAISGVAMNLNQWHHLVGTVDSSGNMKIYLDGVLTGSATGAPSRTMTQGINYGVYLDGTTYFHDGQIDQIRYYSTALDSDQVSQLYNEKPCADTSNFKTVLYEGTGSTQYISNVGMDLETDGGLVWVKKRDGVHDHKLADSVRGATKIIESSTADAEITATGSINAFNANGFEVGSDSSVNGNGNDFVAWVWKGGGDAVSNTNGDITSQVSANTDAGFSIVKYSGNTGANQTVGHGLSSTPEMVIVKRLTDSGYSWCVQHTGLTSMGYNIYLDDTLGELLRNRITAWNSTTFTVEQIHETNNTGEDYIAYCFHSVSGYSKIGSYTGAGSGTRVYTTSDGTSTGTGGFKPSWIMLKNASVGGTNYDWYIYDVRRNDNDGDDNIESYLRANLSSAEVTSNTGSNGIVMEDDGFTLDIAATSINGTGNTFIYMAFK